MKINALKNWAFALLVFLAASRMLGQENLVPPPKTDAEIKKMMGITYDLHVLPEGAKPEMLEHLLEIGEVVVYYDHGIAIPWISAAGIMIDAPAEQVFSVLTDYTHYPSFVPMTDAVEVKKIRDNFVRVDFHLNVQMSFLKYRIDYGVYHNWRPPFRSDWAHAFGEFGINCGFAELIPTADGKRTMFFYAVYSQPQSAFLKSIYAREPTVEVMTSLSTAIMFVRAMKAQSEKRVGTGKAKIAANLKPQRILEALSEDPEGMKKILDRGNILVLEDGPTVYAVGGGLVNAPIQAAYSVISDFKTHPQFIPGAKKVELLDSGKAGETYRWELLFNLAFFRYTQDYEVTYQFTPPELITWQMPRPCCGPVSCFWKLIPLENKTMIFTGSSADVRSLGFIPKYALEKEPTFEHAALASQALVVINSMKQRISEKNLGQPLPKK